MSDTTPKIITVEQLQKLLEQAESKLSHEARIEDMLEDIKSEKQELKELKQELKELKQEVTSTNALILKEVYDNRVLETNYADNYIAYATLFITLVLAATSLIAWFFGNKLFQQYIKNNIDARIEAKLKPIQTQTTENTAEIEKVEKEQIKAATRQEKNSKLLLELSASNDSNEKINIITKAINEETNITEQDVVYLAKLHFRRGYHHSTLNQHDLAIADYSKAIELNPQYAEAYGNRGVAYKNQGQYDLAIADYNKAIAFNPQDADVYYNRAVAVYETSKDEEATIKDLAQAIEHDETKRALAKNNPVFLPLHSNPAFRKLVGLD